MVNFEQLSGRVTGEFERDRFCRCVLNKHSHLIENDSVPVCNSVRAVLLFLDKGVFQRLLIFPARSVPKVELHNRVPDRRNCEVLNVSCGPHGISIWKNLVSRIGEVNQVLLHARLQWQFIRGKRQYVGRFRICQHDPMKRAGITATAQLPLLSPRWAALRTAGVLERSSRASNTSTQWQQKAKLVMLSSKESVSSWTFFFTLLGPIDLPYATPSIGGSLIAPAALPSLLRTVNSPLRKLPARTPRRLGM